MAREGPYFTFYFYCLYLVHFSSIVQFLPTSNTSKGFQLTMQPVLLLCNVQNAADVSEHDKEQLQTLCASSLRETVD